MLLSFPTWIIHISSMLEWAIAFILLYKYGRLINRKDIQKFALLMIPHWIGGMCVIFYHISGDTLSILLDFSKLINFFGSIALITGSLLVINHVKSDKNPELVSTAIIPLFPFILIHFLPDYNAIIATLFQISSVLYLVFLALVLYIYRIDELVFSKLTVVGFWFVLVFVIFTVACIELATNHRGFPTLTHDDFLHGLAESFLSLSNLMIALGVNQKIREHRKLSRNAG